MESIREKTRSRNNRFIAIAISIALHLAILLFLWGDHQIDTTENQQAIELANVNTPKSK